MKRTVVQWNDQQGREYMGIVERVLDDCWDANVADLAMLKKARALGLPLPLHPVVIYPGGERNTVVTVTRDQIKRDSVSPEVYERLMQGEFQMVLNKQLDDCGYEVHVIKPGPAHAMMEKVVVTRNTPGFEIVPEAGRGSKSKRQPSPKEVIDLVTPPTSPPRRSPPRKVPAIRPSPEGNGEYLSDSEEDFWGEVKTTPARLVPLQPSPPRKVPATRPSPARLVPSDLTVVMGSNKFRDVLLILREVMGNAYTKTQTWPLTAYKQGRLVNMAATNRAKSISVEISTTATRIESAAPGAVRGTFGPVSNMRDIVANSKKNFAATLILYGGVEPSQRFSMENGKSETWKTPNVNPVDVYLGRNAVTAYTAAFDFPPLQTIVKAIARQMAVISTIDGALVISSGGQEVIRSTRGFRVQQPEVSVQVAMSDLKKIFNTKALERILKAPVEVSLRVLVNGYLQVRLDGIGNTAITYYVKGVRPRDDPEEVELVPFEYTGLDVAWKELRREAAPLVSMLRSIMPIVEYLQSEYPVVQDLQYFTEDDSFEEVIREYGLTVPFTDLQMAAYQWAVTHFYTITEWQTEFGDRIVAEKDPRRYQGGTGPFLRRADYYLALLWRLEGRDFSWDDYTGKDGLNILSFEVPEGDEEAERAAVFDFFNNLDVLRTSKTKRKGGYVPLPAPKDDGNGKSSENYDDDEDEEDEDYDDGEFANFIVPDDEEEEDDFEYDEDDVGGLSPMDMSCSVCKRKEVRATCTDCKKKSTFCGAACELAHKRVYH